MFINVTILWLLCESNYIHFMDIILDLDWKAYVHSHFYLYLSLDIKRPQTEMIYSLDISCKKTEAGKISTINAFISLLVAECPLCDIFNLTHDIWEFSAQNVWCKTYKKTVFNVLGCYKRSLFPFFLFFPAPWKAFIMARAPATFFG